MAINFPSNPSTNQIYTYNGKSWIWNGTAWDLYTSTAFVNTLNGFTGGVTLAGGTYINISTAGNIITISSPGDGPCGYVSSFNGQAGAVTGVGTAVAGSGISVSGATGNVTITNTGVTGIQAGTGISVTSTTGNPTITNIGVQSFNGSTGAITGVSSVRGLTGTIGITNSSGIGLSISGQTLTFSNSGVLSFNSLTGDVTGVTTGTANTFVALQSFTTGISASGGVTLSGNVSMTSTSSHTGLASFLAGISASSGATLTGTINLNGQTFTNLVSSVNGFTGAIGGWLTHPGFTTAAQTFNDSTSNGSNTISYIPIHHMSQNDWGSYVVKANRSYFSLYNVSKPLTIKTIKAISNLTGITGSAFIGVYSADSSTGLPSTRLYDSGSLTVGSSYAGVSVTNASGLVTVPAGFFYVSVTFSLTPTMFAFNKTRLPAMYGARSFSGGQFNIMPIADYSGFTHAASLPVSGVTLGFLEQSAGNYTGIVTEILIL